MTHFCPFSPIAHTTKLQVHKTRARAQSKQLKSFKKAIDQRALRARALKLALRIRVSNQKLKIQIEAIQYLTLKA